MTIEQAIDAIAEHDREEAELVRSIIGRHLHGKTFDEQLREHHALINGQSGIAALN